MSALEPPTFKDPRIIKHRGEWHVWVWHGFDGEDDGDCVRAKDFADAAQIFSIFSKMTETTP